MLKLVSHIIFSREGNKLFSFDYTCEVEITTSWENLTQIAKIEIPNAFRNKNKFIINEIKRGDQIEIYLGYLKDRINKTSQPSLTRRFIGYVTKISPGYVVKMECEDEMWKLKQTTIDGYSKASPITLKQLIDDLKKKTGLTFQYDISDTSDLGTIIITPGNSFCDAIEFLRSKYLILAYFRDGKLIMKKANQFIGNPEKTFIVQRNIIGADSMEYQNEKDVHLMIKMTNQVPQVGKEDKKVTRYIFYDAKGIIQSSITPKAGYNQIEHITSIPKTEAELIKEGKELLKVQTYTGYKGDFDTFGEPVVNFGDYANIKDFRYPERTGRYLLRAVNITFGKNGYRQRIQIYGKG